MFKFDPTNEVHVNWLKDSFQKVDAFYDPNTQKKSNRTLLTFINSNTFGLNINDKNFNDFPMLHSLISMKYAKAVLEGKAFIP